MKKAMLLAAALLAIAPASLLADNVTLRIGYFSPTFNRDNPDSLWTIEFANMNFGKNDFRQAMFGVEYDLFITPQLALGLSLDTFSKQKFGTYMDYGGITVDNADFAFLISEVPNFDFNLQHIFATSVTPLQLSVKVTPLGRRGRVIPYLGGGVGLYFWNARITGDRVDFSAPTEFLDQNDNVVIGYPVDIVDAREGLQTAFGYHGFGGVMVPVGNRLTVDGMFKWNWAKGDMKKAFQGFAPFDVGGWILSIGINYWF